MAIFSFLVATLFDSLICQYFTGLFLMSYDFLCFDFIKRLYRVKFGYYPNYTNVGYTEENLQELVTF